MLFVRVPKELLAWLDSFAEQCQSAAGSPVNRSDAVRLIIKDRIRDEERRASRSKNGNSGVQAAAR